MKKDFHANAFTFTPAWHCLVKRPVGHVPSSRDVPGRGGSRGDPYGWNDIAGSQPEGEHRR